MQGKQLALLGKLEQLGQECNTLRVDLGAALHDREGMALMLTNLEHKCGQLQQQLIIEEVCIHVCMHVFIMKQAVYIICMVEMYCNQ